jgi:hypothetical protein
MIPYDIDPSLHNTEPEPPLFDDGFSRRPHAGAGEAQSEPGPVPAAEVDPSLSGKSPF